MIGHLRGQLLVKKPNLVLLDVHGVGYEVHIPLTSFYELPTEGNEVSLKIHTHLREAELTLYGFSSQREKGLFLQLISIGGIGPKLAIGILSGAKVEELAQAIAQADSARLTLIPGVGRKTAERIVLELKNKIASFLPPKQEEEPGETTRIEGIQEDILSALVNLGYPRNAAEMALSKVVSDAECNRTFEELLKHTLRRLAS